MPLFVACGSLPFDFKIDLQKVNAGISITSLRGPGLSRALQGVSDSYFPEFAERLSTFDRERKRLFAERSQ